MDEQVTNIILREADRQNTTIELIASENHVSSAVTEAVGSCMTNKYAEGTQVRDIIVDARITMR